MYAEKKRVTHAEEKRMSIGSGTFAIVAGLGVIAYFGWIAIQQSSAVSWPTTTARIVTSQVEVEQDSYLANIIFEYTVDGATHQSTELWFDSEPAGSQKDMQELVAKYPRGSSIGVYYNPNNPSQAVVDPRKNAMFAKWCIGFGFCAVMLGAYFLFDGLTSKPVESCDDGEFLLDPTETKTPAMKRQPATTAIAWVPQSSVKPEAPEPLKPKGPRHWAVRVLSGIIGVPVLVLFGGATVVILQQGMGPQAKHPLPVIIFSTAITGGVTLFGLWLTAICFIRRGNPPQAV